MKSLRPILGPVHLCQAIALGLMPILAACDASTPNFIERATPLIQSEDVLEGQGEGAARGDETADDRGETSDGPVAAEARWAFQASSLARGALNLDVASGRIEQRFVLESNLSDKQLDFTQVNRPVTTETFLQGTESEYRSESFQQAANASGLLDVLVVIDNSGSMSNEQNNLSARLLPLLSYVGNSDWRIGVVTTDPNNGCLRGLIKKSDSNPSQLFAQAVTAGTQGSGVERGILQAVNGLKGQCNSSGSWLRSNSTLAVLIVSDEDNCSEGNGCGTDPWARGDYLIDYMSSIRQVGVNARVYGLVWHPSVAQSACNTALHRANIYADVISRTGGSWGSICDTDYSRTLQAISLDISQILRKQFTLQYTPFPRSVKVFVNDVQRTQGFQVKGNVIEFAEAPVAGSRIRIDYEFSNEPPKRDFQLTQNADPSTLQVYTDGQLNTNYSYDAASRTVRFRDAPLVYEVRTIYRTAGGLNTDFSIGRGARTGSVRVKVDGQNLNANAFTYVSNTGVVRLQTAPKDQAKIQILFTQEVEPRLRYPLYASSAARAQVRVYDAATNAELAVRIEQDEIVFPVNLYRPLRAVIARYPQSGQGIWSVEIGQTVLEDSLKVSGSVSGACDRFVAVSSTVDLSLCRFASNEAVAIEYTYITEHRTVFDLGELDFDPEAYRWIVTVDGQETRDYLIEDRWLSFLELPFNAEVEVKVVRQ